MSERFYCLNIYMPLRCEPYESSECVSTLLYGESYTVKQVIQNQYQSNWLEIICDHDQYSGYISEANHLNHSTHFESPILCISPQPHPENPQIWLSPGSYMNQKNHHESPILSDQDWLFQFLGVPYLWGGRSIYGIDCSGFSQQYLRFKGLPIPRDAKDQAKLGETIRFGAHQFGDLAFFGKKNGNDGPKITHVGIVLSSEDIIHASALVRTDLFEESGIVRKTDRKLTHELITIKRFI